MFIIKNINPINGDSIEFMGNTLDEAIETMKDSLRECGYSDDISEGKDYEVIFNTEKEIK